MQIKFNLFNDVNINKNIVHEVNEEINFQHQHSTEIQCTYFISAFPRPVHNSLLQRIEFRTMCFIGTADFIPRVLSLLRYSLERCFQELMECFTVSEDRNKEFPNIIVSVPKYRY